MELPATASQPPPASSQVVVSALSQRSNSSEGSRRRTTRGGRRARKRNQKRNEIEAAVEAAAGGHEDLMGLSTRIDTIKLHNKISTINETSKKNSQILPSDRSHVQAGIEEICTLSNADRSSLLQQLGYIPGNALQVVARVKDILPKEFILDQKGETTTTPTPNSLLGQEPVVLKLYPLVLRQETDGTRSQRKRKPNREEQLPLDGLDDIKKNSSNMLMEPFPTIYWVTHPYIKAIISKLELDRINDHYEFILKQGKDYVDNSNDDNNNGYKSSGDQVPQNEQISSTSAIPSSVFLSSSTSPNPTMSPCKDVYLCMKQAHEEYKQERLCLLLPKDLQYIAIRGWKDKVYNDSGIAGIRNLIGNKCLHAHAAHYWSGCTNNIIGKWVSEQVIEMIVENIGKN